MDHVTLGGLGSRCFLGMARHERLPGEFHLPRAHRSLAASFHGHVLAALAILVIRGVLSWAGAPFFEELFYRGYCQRRLAEDWGDGPAIMGASCLFTFSHAQYLRPDAYNASMVVGLLLSAIGFGIVFAWTRSLIPSMIAHAVFDIPMTTLWQGVLLAGLVIGALVVWRRATPLIRQFLPTGNTGSYLALGIVGAGYAVLTSIDRIGILLVAISSCMLIGAVVLEARDRRNQRKSIT